MRMENAKRLARRIEINYAALQGTYWFSYCAISGFVVVFLSHRGLSNTEIGYATAFSSTIAILLQLFMSNVLDKHPELPIRRLITALFLVGITAGSLVQFVPMSAVAMSMVYAVCYAMGQSNNGYLNAQFVQYNNAGIPARFGWPRGVGSFGFAISAFLYGKLVEAFSPEILMPCYLVGTVICIGFVLLMPNPDAVRLVSPERKTQHHTSYRQMLSGNPALIVLLLCTLLNSTGNMAGYTFVLRVVERVGGGTAEYGISEFIRAAAEVPALFASGFLIKHFKVKSMLAASFMFFGLRLLLLASASNIGLVYFASSINLLCVGLSTFSSVMFVNSIVRDTEKVRGQSLCVLCSSIGTIFGNAYAGAMIDHVGLTAMLLTSAVFCLVAFAGMVFLCKPEKQALRS